MTIEALRIRGSHRKGFISECNDTARRKVGVLIWISTHGISSKHQFWAVWRAEPWQSSTNSIEESTKTISDANLRTAKWFLTTTIKRFTWPAFHPTLGSFSRVFQSRRNFQGFVIQGFWTNSRVWCFFSRVLGDWGIFQGFFIQGFKKVKFHTD